MSQTMVVALQLKCLTITYQSFRSGRKTLLFNTSIKFGKIDDTNIKKDIDRIKIAKADEGFDEVQEENGSIFANSSTFEQQIKSLMSSYEQVFICSDNQKINR